MYRLNSSAVRPSSFCWSDIEPRVAIVSACVCPRVKRPDPCVRGSTPTSTVIGRTSARPRPSTRTPSSTMRWRTRSLSLFEQLADDALVLGKPLPELEDRSRLELVESVLARLLVGAVKDL